MQQNLGCDHADGVDKKRTLSDHPWLTYAAIGPSRLPSDGRFRPDRRTSQICPLTSFRQQVRCSSGRVRLLGWCGPKTTGSTAQRQRARRGQLPSHFNVRGPWIARLSLPHRTRNRPSAPVPPHPPVLRQPHAAWELQHVAQCGLCWRCNVGVLCWYAVARFSQFCK